MPGNARIKGRGLESPSATGEKYEGYAARWLIDHHAADHSHSSIRNQDARVLATENSFDFVCHSMNILFQHKVACIQPNELGFR